MKEMNPLSPRRRRPALDRDSKDPLWRQLRTDLIGRIDAHEFDDEFPGELSLAESYGVSRQTVRLALRDLRTTGILSAERGRPPRVLHTIKQPIGALYSLFASVRATGMTQHSVVLALDERRDSEAAARLGLPADDWLIYLERLRLANDNPLAWDRAWLPASFARPLLQVEFTDTALYVEMHRLLDRAPTGGREEIDCCNLTPPEADLLQLEPGSAAFSLSRIGCHHGEPVEYRETLIRSDHFSLVAQFSPGSGYVVSPGAPTPRQQRRIPNKPALPTSPGPLS